MITVKNPCDSLYNPLPHPLIKFQILVVLSKPQLLNFKNKIGCNNFDYTDGPDTDEHIDYIVTKSFTPVIKIFVQNNVILITGRGGRVV